MGKVTLPCFPLKLTGLSLLSLPTHWTLLTASHTVLTTYISAHQEVMHSRLHWDPSSSALCWIQTAHIYRRRVDLGEWQLCECQGFVQAQHQLEQPLWWTGRAFEGPGLSVDEN